MCRFPKFFRCFLSRKCNEIDKNLIPGKKSQRTTFECESFIFISPVSVCCIWSDIGFEQINTVQNCCFSFQFCRIHSVCYQKNRNRYEAKYFLTTSKLYYEIVCVCVHVPSISSISANIKCYMPLNGWRKIGFFFCCSVHSMWLLLLWLLVACLSCRHLKCVYFCICSWFCSIEMS